MLNQLHNLNAFTFSFDEKLLESIRDSYKKDLEVFINNPRNNYLFEGGKTHRKSIGNYYIFSYDEYPLLWFSNNSIKTFDMYKNFFESLKMKDYLKNLIDFDKKITMYCGFFVIGNNAPRELWHIDFRNNANAYTLITPLYELENNHGNLLYEINNEKTGTYNYKLGEAIIFGENFLHSTEPYKKTDKFRVLVSFTFGTDKLKYWEIIKHNVKAQSKYYSLPCGHISGKCICLIKEKLKRVF